MKFLCLYRPGTPESNDPPPPELQSAMGALIAEMVQAGVLLATEGCYGSERGAHARSAVGVAELPFGLPVEIEAEVLIRV